MPLSMPTFLTWKPKKTNGKESPNEQIAKLSHWYLIWPALYVWLVADRLYRIPIFLYMYIAQNGTPVDCSSVTVHRWSTVQYDPIWSFFGFIICKLSPLLAGMVNNFKLYMEQLEQSLFGFLVRKVAIQSHTHRIRRI